MKIEKVTSINRGKRDYLGGYPQKAARIPEGLPFMFGVLSTVFVPQLVLSAYSGEITFVVLAASTLLAAVAGAFAYRYVPYRMPRCVEAEADSRFPPRRNREVKKAA